MHKGMFQAEGAEGAGGEGSRANITRSWVPRYVHGAFAVAGLCGNFLSHGKYRANFVNLLTFEHILVPMLYYLLFILLYYVY